MEGYNRYNGYKIARDRAWQTLIDSGVCELPVNLKKVACTYEIEVYSYKAAVSRGLMSWEEAEGSSFSKLIEGKRYIFVSNIQSDGEVRIYIACEIGHFVLGHKIYRKPRIKNKFGKNDYEAYIFARDLLMPAVVLYGLKVSSADAIEKLCNVTHELAQKRAVRMSELSDRKQFNVHPAERMVSEQFEKFIDEYKV